MRRGLTVVEALVALAILSMVFAGCYQLWIHGAQGAELAVEAGEAVRSVMVAAEYLQSDVARMVIQDPERDVVLEPRGMSFRVALPATRKDLWKVQTAPVAYRLEPARGAHVLVRSHVDAAGKRVVEELKSCLLASLEVRLVDGSLMEITLEGLGKPRGSARYRASFLVPVATTRPPAPYFLGGRVGYPAVDYKEIF